MELRILDREFNFVGAIDNFNSLVINRKYNDIDVATITLDKSTVNANLLIKGSYVFTEDKMNKFFRIYNRKEVAGANGTTVTVVGYSVEKLLKQRITMPPANTSYDTQRGTVDGIIKQYVTNNCINSTNPLFNYSFLTLGTNSGLSAEFTDKTRYKNLYEEIQRLAALYDLGTKSYYDYTNKKIVFDVFKGVDRSATSGANPVIFSFGYDNLLSSELEYNYSTEQNYAIVAGQGEGADRTIIEVSDKIFTATNLIVNGSFEDGLTGWTTNVAENIKSVQTKTLFGNYALQNKSIYRYASVNTKINAIVGHKYYCGCHLYSVARGSLVTYNDFGVFYDNVEHWGYHDGKNKQTAFSKWEKISSIITVPNVASPKLSFAFVNSNATDGLFEAYGDGAFCIDLTATFGVGNEPTKEWCDANIPYFDGTKKIAIQEAYPEDIEVFFQDARDISAINELMARGREEMLITEGYMTATINPFANQKYEVDYDLGDLVTLVVDDVQIDTRIIEVNEVYQGANAMQLDVVFGKTTFDLTTIMKKQNTKIARLETI